MNWKLVTTAIEHKDWETLICVIDNYKAFWFILAKALKKSLINIIVEWAQQPPLEPDMKNRYKKLNFADIARHQAWVIGIDKETLDAICSKSATLP